MKTRSVNRSITLGLMILLLSATVASIVPGVIADGTLPPAVKEDMRQRAQDSVIRGLDWYAETQQFDGSWDPTVGVTGLIIMCFTGAGYDYTNATVQRALGHMRLNYYPETGALADAFPNYETAIALIAMAAAGDPQDADKLPMMAAYLENLQFSDDSEYNKTDPWYQGGWPNYAGIPDVSNSQFAMLGLTAYELLSDNYTIPDNVLANATGFMMNCQNWPEVNDLPWAHNITLPSYGDGGFVYNAYRSRTPLGEDKFESYGSITAAGYYSYLAAGHDDRNPEVEAARAWLEHEYNLDINPRMVGKGLYYYLWTQTRALALSGQDWVVDGAGKLHDWRADVAQLFMDLQNPDGGWPGNPMTGWREEEPEIAGVYAILSLQAAYMSAPNPELEIQVVEAGPVLFIDLQGNVLKSDPTKDLEVTDTSLRCSDPEVFRKIWVEVTGAFDGMGAMGVYGRWGDGREVLKSVSLQAGDSRLLVTTGGFAGPFGIHVTDFGSDSPAFKVDKKSVELARGDTQVIDFELTETSGRGPLNRAMLITYAGEGVVADVDVQGIDVAAGDVDVLRLTISVDQDASAGRDSYLVISSATAPPEVVPIKIVDSATDEAAMGLWYWLVISALVVMVFFFLLLPRVAGRKEETPEPLAQEDEEEPVPEPREDAGPSTVEGEGKTG